MKAKGPKLDNSSSSSGIIEGKDFKFVPVKPDPDFSVEHNKWVIKETIRKNNAKMRKIQQEYDQTLEERGDAAASFLKWLSNSKFDPKRDSSRKAALKYFGKRELARLRGQEIKDQIMEELRGNRGILES